MPSFAIGQLAFLVDAFWNHQDLACPHDGAALAANIFADPNGYLLVLACPQCGAHSQVTRHSDARRQLFRAWSDHEREVVTLVYQRNGSAKCPVCFAPVTRRQGTPEGSGGNAGYVGEHVQVLACDRCGNAHAGLLRLDAAPAQQNGRLATR